GGDGSGNPGSRPLDPGAELQAAAPAHERPALSAPVAAGAWLCHPAGGDQPGRGYPVYHTFGGGGVYGAADAGRGVGRPAKQGGGRASAGRASEPAFVPGGAGGRGPEEGCGAGRPAAGGIGAGLSGPAEHEGGVAVMATVREV